MKVLAASLRVGCCNEWKRASYYSCSISLQQVTCEDILDDVREVLTLFIDRSLFLDCLLIDPESCYSALRGEDLPYVEESPLQVSKGKKKDGRRYTRALNNDQLYMYRLSHEW